jgi:hypothetical protein
MYNPALSNSTHLAEDAHVVSSSSDDVDDEGRAQSSKEDSKMASVSPSS